MRKARYGIRRYQVWVTAWVRIIGDLVTILSFTWIDFEYDDRLLLHWLVKATEKKEK